MAIDTTAPRSRRSILAGALGGAGALIAASLGRAAPAAAATGDPLLLGKGGVATENAATAATVVNATADPGFWAKVSAAATALKGTSATGAGVHGQSGANPPDGTDTSQTGVYGFSDAGDPADAGVWGDTLAGVGTVGTGDWGVVGLGVVGVVGLADELSTGIHGFAGTGAPNLPAPGTAIHGHAGPGAKTGIYASASSPTQTAFYVSGGFKTSRSGRKAIGATATSLRIPVVGATTSSWVVATLQSNVSGVYVRAAVPSTNAITVYLNKAPGTTVIVGFLVVN